jgi:polyribonucleotide nucleotidyltransferase
VTSIKKSFPYGEHEVTIETGEIARQATGSVLVSMADTVVLVTAVGQREGDAGRPFFPLTVNYQEKTYAAGKIPGGFFKREGRPSEKETLTSRLIDRPIRPLFPKGFMNEVQIIATVISINTEVNPDIPAMLGTSAALALSGIPFAGPVAGARVGFINDDYVLNPSNTQLQDSKLDLIVAGTANAVLMVESQADVLSESVMLGAVMFGHEQMQAAINAIKELASEAGKPTWDWQPAQVDATLVDAVAAQAQAAVTEAYAISDKQERYARIAAVKAATVESLAAGEDSAYSRDDIGGEFHNLESRIVRERVLSGEKRIDGRDTDEVRAHRPAAADPRIGSVHSWRNAGDRGRNHGYRSRCADHRCPGRRNA